MADYPDYTELMQIIGSDIMVPMDIQAAYIMMPVDIQAQYLTLDINIKAKEVTLTIDIEAQHVGIYLKADWEVLQGTDKNLYGYASVPNNTLVTVLDYTIPTGPPAKTFYVCQWSFSVSGDGGVNAWLDYFHDSTGYPIAVNGGRCGGVHSLTKPMAVVAGDHVRVLVHHWVGSEVTGRGCIGGYEL